MGPEQPRLEDPVRPLRPEVPAVLAGLVLPSRLEVLADPAVPVRPLHPQVPEVLASLVLPSRLEALADQEVPGRLLLLAIQVERNPHRSAFAIFLAPTVLQPA